MFQLGIKGEGYGRCLLIEWEWLRSFFEEVDRAAEFMTKLACLRGTSDEYDIRLLDERREWAVRLSALRYSMNNYAESEEIDYEATLIMMQKRYSYLSILSVGQIVAECSCAGCGAIEGLFDSADVMGLINDMLLTSFLAGGASNG